MIQLCFIDNGQFPKKIKIIIGGVVSRKLTSVHTGKPMTTTLDSLAKVINQNVILI